MKLFTLPNFITLGNLICGCLGIISVFETDYKKASAFIFIALLLDFADGFVARLLKISSEIGKELDSLADVVTFGVLPSIMIFKYIELSTPTDSYLKYLAFVLTGFSALRLAKFNLDTRQSDSFIGLPTPANGIVVATFPFLLENTTYHSLLSNPHFLILYSLIFSYLLIMEVPLFALKFKTFDWATNRVKYIFLLICVVLLALLQIAAVPAIVLIYLATSFLLQRGIVG
jgi:CDP-diacylglycerol---serine O-phosphatidyltransferase